MRLTRFFFRTVKEIPSEASLISHKLMLRAGLIQNLASGLYSWLPLGLIALKKIQSIVQETLETTGALAVQFPNVLPAELWKTSQRWEKYGKELLRFTDRHDNDFCYAPTHEEAAVQLIKTHLKSYKQLPLTLYQISTKFRDEIRPRFGVMRAREFVMKDAYSFHMNTACLQAQYDTMHQAYTTLFTKMGLNFCSVLADTGNIGGDFSHEFHALAESGEDLIAHTPNKEYAANIELATAWSPDPAVPPKAESPLLIHHTLPHNTTYTQLCEKHHTPFVRAYFIQTSANHYIGLLLSGKDTPNINKINKLPDIPPNPIFCTEKSICDALDIPLDGLAIFSAPAIKFYVDPNAAALNNFSFALQTSNTYSTHIHWHRDIALPEIYDLRTVASGDRACKGKEPLLFSRGIEIGHLFQLGDTYTRTMHAPVIQATGKATFPLMGCYGIGISRTLAAIIEQHHDDRGILWPKNIAPFSIGLIGVNQHKSQRVQQTTESLYKMLKEANLEVLWDDRRERPGIQFADMDLIGIPHRIVVSDSGLDAEQIEYKNRHTGAIEMLPIKQLLPLLRAIINS